MRVLCQSSFLQIWLLEKVSQKTKNPRSVLSPKIKPLLSFGTHSESICQPKRIVLKKTARMVWGRSRLAPVWVVFRLLPAQRQQCFNGYSFVCLGVCWLQSYCATAHFKQYYWSNFQISPFFFFLSSQPNIFLGLMYKDLIQIHLKYFRRFYELK